MNNKNISAAVNGPLNIDSSMTVQNLCLLAEMLGKKVKYVRVGKKFQATVGRIC